MHSSRVDAAEFGEAAGALQERKLIRCILDVDGLRSNACSCYGLIREIEKG